MKLIQAKFKLNESHVHFLEQCNSYGFKDKSEAVRHALDKLCGDIEKQQCNLLQSAMLYREIYAEDTELNTLTESAIADWPL